MLAGALTKSGGAEVKHVSMQMKQY